MPMPPRPTSAKISYPAMFGGGSLVGRGAEVITVDATVSPLHTGHTDGEPAASVCHSWPCGQRSRRDMSISFRQNGRETLLRYHSGTRASFPRLRWLNQEVVQGAAHEVSGYDRRLLRARLLFNFSSGIFRRRGTECGRWWIGIPA